MRDKIGHHKIGADAEMGQKRIRGGGGVKKIQKTSDIIYVCSLMCFSCHIRHLTKCPNWCRTWNICFLLIFS